MQIDHLLSECMLASQFRLKKWQQKIIRMPKEAQEKQFVKWHETVQKSIQQRQNRLINKPVITYPELPITLEKENILNALINNQVVIVAGETGSGKTTQLGKICLEAGLGIKGLIGHTQPRRIAARTMALRIAAELMSPIGKFVGYKVRFSDKTQAGNYIKVMTDGILLSETLTDKWLMQYDCLIIDEAHERSLNIDFLLGYIRNLIAKRSDLKIVITSATINVERFSQYFYDAPIIEVQGRSYPVKTYFLNKDFHVESDDPILQVASAVTLACQQGPGDILIFQSGEKEIREVIEVLSTLRIEDVILLPLFSRQSQQEQQKIFQRMSKRKIIVTTNVAETSLTVPNIRYVIDSGFARISRYNYRTKLQRLPIEPISQASANQRKGRCGRIGPGICYRLYTEEDFQNRALYTEPEILRTSLASVILKMLSLNLTNIGSFPFLDAPDNRHIKDGFTLLERLMAVNEKQQITPIGRMLAKIPIEPKLGAVIIKANQMGALNEILVIVSALSIVDVRENPQEYKAQAQSKHVQFSHENSDFMTLLNLWDFLLQHQKSLSHNKFRKLCKENFLSYLRVCEWIDVHSQLTQISEELGFKKNQIVGEYSQIHKSLLQGFIDTIGLKQEKQEYLGARGIKFYIHPSSVLFKKTPTWMVASEIVHTTKSYARTCAYIEAKWIEEVASKLLKKQYDEPHFDPKWGNVVALEKGLLFGLEIYSKRKINYENYAISQARQIFIEQALVQEQMLKEIPFYYQNKETRKKVEQLENRIRRQKILFDEIRIYQFYDERLPLNVCSVISLEKHINEQSDTHLIFSEKDICLEDVPENLLAQFPLNLSIKGQNFALDYEFDLTSPFDGVTLTVPFELLKYIKDEDFSWLIPGLVAEKISFYLKSLPKSIRAQLVPLPVYIEKAKLCLSTKNILTKGLVDFLQAQLKQTVVLNIFDKIVLPAHLKMHFKVTHKNNILTSGDDLQAIYTQLQDKYLALYANEQPVEQSNFSQWHFNDLPLSCVIKKQNLDFTYYPSIVDKQSSVSVQLFENHFEAEYKHRYGLARLFLLHLSEAIKSIKKNITQQDKKIIIKLYAPFGEYEQFLDELLLACALFLFIDEKENIRTQAQFVDNLARYRTLFVNSGNQLLKVLLQSLTSYQLLNSELVRLKEKHLYNKVYHDVSKQLQRLFEKHFIKSVPMVWLNRYPIYLKAIEQRLAKLPRELPRDDQGRLVIETVNKAYESKLSAKDLLYCSPFDPLICFRWKIEELRVSIFAQELKTIETVSKIRLLKLLENL
ncbi:MAG: ATP-dependent RNA helicase HrpA [Proteobacteria bacterium]|nr:ATP-dependent RNA helicase HrpA [Pseudomonadota bacterium]